MMMITSCRERWSHEQRMYTVQDTWRMETTKVTGDEESDTKNVKTGVRNLGEKDVGKKDYYYYYCH